MWAGLGRDACSHFFWVKLRRLRKDPKESVLIMGTLQGASSALPMAHHVFGKLI